MAKENENPTQCSMLIEWLKDGNAITQLSALKLFGIMRLASRMNEIIHNYGLPIEKRKVVVPTRFAGAAHITEYRLKKNE